VGTAISRWIMKKYKTITIRKEDWEKLKEISDRERKPLTDTIKLLIELYYKCRGEVGNE